MTDTTTTTTTPTAPENQRDYLFGTWTRHYLGLGLSGVIAIPNTTNTDWLVYFNQWLEQVGTNFDNLNSDFDALVAQYNAMAAAIPGQISSGIDSKFAEERPGMVDEVLTGLEDKIFADFRQPVGASFLPKLETEFNQRGLNITWYGALPDGTTDNTTAIMNAYNDAIAKNTFVFVPAGVYFARFVNVPDIRLFQGNGVIVNDGKRFNISTNINHADGKKLQNSVAFSRYTYGRFNTAAAVSINANTEDEAAVVGITDDSIGLSNYDNRDSVALFTTNTSHGWHITTPSLGFGADYVDVAAALDLSNIRVGMFVDTDEPIKATGIVKSVVGNRVNVNKWVRRGATDAGIIPAMPSNVIINPTTAIWGQNTVLQIDPQDQDMAVTGYEMDIINNQPHRLNIDGFTVVSDGTVPANAAFTARAIHSGLWNTSFKSEGGEYGLFHSGGSVGAHIENPHFVGFEAKNAPIAFASQGDPTSIFLRITDKSNAPTFEMLNNGEMSRFKLQRQLAAGAVTAPVVFATGDVSLPDPGAYPNEIRTLTNTTSNNIKVTSRLNYQGLVYQYLLLKPFTSIMLVSDGIEYYILNFSDPISIP